MELTVTTQSGRTVILNKREYKLQVYPFDVIVRAEPKNIITAKGQLLVGLGNTSVGVLNPSTNGMVLTLDDSTPEGIAWKHLASAPYLLN
jgi:hypothetical protein